MGHITIVKEELTLYLKGFDTASSIALLAVSAIAKHDANGKGIPTGSIVILPVCTMPKSRPIIIFYDSNLVTIHRGNDTSRFIGLHIDALLILWFPGKRLGITPKVQKVKGQTTVISQ